MESISSSFTASSRTGDAAKLALGRAVEFAKRTQRSEGCWEASPDPRILDTAVTAICLAAGPGAGRDEVAKARRWLSTATVQRHDAFAAALEEWLLMATLDGNPTSVPGLAGGIEIPRGRALLVEMLAVCAGSPDASPRRLMGLVAAAAPRTGLKQWQRALLAAAEILGHAGLSSAVPAGAMRALLAEQGEDGAFCQMPVVTGLAYAALAADGTAPEATRRCLDYIMRSQHSDGTWRYLSFEIWDTTLMIRSLRGVPAFDERLLDPALRFLEQSQSPDGGWAGKRGIESDNDTTSSALLALAAAEPDEAVMSAAAHYLRRVQREDGLWTTWQSSDDTPSSDVTAHVVAAVAAHPAMGIDVSRAKDWLVGQYRRTGEWTAQWYSFPAYAVAEIAEAVGWADDASRDAVRRLAGGQRSDGGWPCVEQDDRSDPAATGLALSACLRSSEVPSAVVVAAADYLARTQTADGTWRGLPAMAGPRPFLSHLPTHTHAFAAAGLRDLVVRLPDAQPADDRRTPGCPDGAGGSGHGLHSDGDGLWRLEKRFECRLSSATRRGSSAESVGRYR